MGRPKIKLRLTPEQYRTILHRRLEEALSESFYDVFAARVEMIHKECGMFLTGKEAVAHYLVKKFGWTLEYARSLTLHDLQTVLFDEHDWLYLPSELQAIYSEALGMIERFESPAPKKPKLHSSGGSSKGSGKNSNN